MVGLGCGELPSSTGGGTGTGSGPDVSTSISEIQGGVLDSGDPAVGAILSSSAIINAGTLCSGTLIAPSYVLTAKHCAVGITNMTFSTGSAYPFLASATRAVDQTIPHPSLDLLILHLASPIMDVAPVAVPVAAPPAIGQVCTTVGFGTHNSSATVSDLGNKRSATNAVTASSTTAITVGAGSGFADAGDSGGPLFCNAGLVGVVFNHDGDTPWPNRTFENYTTIDAAWVASILPMTAPPPAAPPPEFAGVTGDFNGDGLADVMAFYDYSAPYGQEGLWVFPGTRGQGDGSSVPYRVSYAGPNAFDVKASKVAAGDFNGDGLTDVLVLYDYGDASAGLFVFPGTRATGDNASIAYRVWHADAGTFDVKRAKIAAGDFNHDGKADLLVMYDYGSASAGLFVFPGTTGTTDGASTPYRVWHVGPNSFDVSRAKITAGDFNKDGMADVIALYDDSPPYGTASIYIIPGTTGTAEGSTAPYRVMHAGPNAFDVNASHVAAGDFNGDGFADLLVMYDYGSASAGVFVFPGTAAVGDSASQGYRVWHAAAGDFNAAATRVTAGDFNGDGKADLMALYDYSGGFGPGSAGLFVFSGTTGMTDTSSAITRVWFVGPGNFEVPRARVP